MSVTLPSSTSSISPPSPVGNVLLAIASRKDLRQFAYCSYLYHYLTDLDLAAYTSVCKTTYQFTQTAALTKEEKQAISKEVGKSILSEVSKYSERPADDASDRRPSKKLNKLFQRYEGLGGTYLKSCMVENFHFLGIPDNERLNYWSYFKEINNVSFKNCNQLRDEHVACVPESTKKISIFRCDKIEGFGFKMLEWESVKVTKCKAFSNRGLSYMQRCKEVLIEKCPITDIGLRYLYSAKKIELGHLDQITDEGLKHISERTESVILSHMHTITDNGLIHLSKCKTIVIRKCYSITRSGILELFKRNFLLESVTIIDGNGSEVITRETGFLEQAASRKRVLEEKEKKIESWQSRKE